MYLYLYLYLYLYCANILNLKCLYNYNIKLFCRFARIVATIANILNLLRGVFMFAIFAPSQVGILIGHIDHIMKILMIVKTPDEVTIIRLEFLSDTLIIS